MSESATTSSYGVHGSSGASAIRLGGAASTGSPIGRGTVLATVAVLGLLFQIGHFAEHAFQFAVWALGDVSGICGRDTPWMSPLADALALALGNALVPAGDRARRMLVGAETLHLIGNGIFLTGLACLYGCLRNRWIRWALYIEGFHLYEHVMLTASAYFVGKPIGLSTLFGGTAVLGSREFQVGFRVTWHFAMNLLPLPFAMKGIAEQWRCRRAEAPSG